MKRLLIAPLRVSAFRTTLRSHSVVTYTPELALNEPNKLPRPAFRILDGKGEVVPTGKLPNDVTEELCQDFYRTMMTLQIVDQIMFEVQRQGRIPFYMTSSGEEGLNIGSASALEPQDHIFAQYREQGVFMYRGLTLEEMMDQCFSTIDDNTKGRQMPVHYGSSRLNIHTVSSPLATQIPQAAGTAYSLKLNPLNDAIAVAYFGEGAASEGDFHAAMNFGATLECPVLFFCRNNGYAISTPVKDQFVGDGIVCRAEGYGMASIRVDGNCVFAVREATKLAREYILKHNRPVLLEAMTYRLGHHSTSDDSTRYRDVDEIQHWQKNLHPIDRLRKFMEQRDMWNADLDTDFRRKTRKRVLESIKTAEKKPKPEAVENLFADVYHEMPPHLIRQRLELEKHIAKYPAYYGESH